MSKEELLFCPLGGSGEIGANMNLYAYGKENDHKWIIVDMGVSFADDSIPGVDLIMPDPGFINFCPRPAALLPWPSAGNRIGNGRICANACKRECRESGGGRPTNTSGWVR